MANKTAPLLPVTERLLAQFGERLRLARLRRRLPAKQVAERAGMSPMTLRSLERGGAGVTMGAYLSVMQVLDIEADIDLLGKADPVGRELQDAQLFARAKPMRKALSVLPPAQVREIAERDASKDADWIEKHGFISAEALAALLDLPDRPPR
jgi:transcriptional regulator with XRE-family HTH domain